MGCAIYNFCPESFLEAFNFVANVGGHLLSSVGYSLHRIPEVRVAMNVQKTTRDVDWSPSPIAVATSCLAPGAIGPTLFIRNNQEWKQ